MQTMWKSNLGFFKWDKFDPINRLIPVSMIPLRGTHSTLKYDSVDATEIVKIYIFEIDLF
jgi:hypothetical protein